MMRARWMHVVSAAAMLTVGSLSSDLHSRGPRFHDDDPIAREPESQDAAAAQPTEIGLLYELSYNLFAVSRRTPSNTRAGNVNTIDEVPDSSWFTNRVGRETVDADRIARGPVAG